MSCDPPRWPVRRIEPLNLDAGPCAWDGRVLLDRATDPTADMPSLVVVRPEADEAELDAIGRALHARGELPLALSLHEPRFARRLPELIRQRLAALRRHFAELVILHLQDASEFKGGGMLQGLTSLREEGIIGRFGLAHDDPRVVEWLALNTPARALAMPIGIDAQHALARAVDATTGYGMTPLALPLWRHGRPGREELRFLLGLSDRVLPVLDTPLPEGLAPMSADELAAARAAWQRDHADPAPLERGRPPMDL